MANLPLPYATNADIVPTLITDYPVQVTAPNPPTYPASAMEWCKYWKAMDEFQNTPEDSPSHHNQRCVLQYRGD